MAVDFWRQRIGLRPRIAAVASVTVGMALTIGAVLLMATLRRHLDTAATATATLRAQDIAALASTDSLPGELALPGEETAFVQIVDQNNLVIASTGNVRGEPAISTARPTGAQVLILTIPVPALGQRSTRVVAIHAKAGALTVYAGENLDAADDTAAAITAVLEVGLPALVFIVAAITWWAVGRTLRPIRDIGRTMADITTSDLHRRVPVPAARDEIRQLAETVNQTLGRLDISVEKQRQFVADASHELRGPLASLRADLEISLTHPEQTAWQNVARDTLGDVERLQHLTDDLLVLARLDSAKHRPPLPVDLAALVRDAVSQTRRSDLTVVASGVDGTVTVHGDTAQLRRMLHNIIYNAERYAIDGITVELASNHGGVSLTISDDGPGIPANDRQRVFERFVRLDDARTNDGGGTGLGLAIVHDIVDAHHGTIRIEDAQPHGTAIIVGLPKVPLPTSAGKHHPQRWIDTKPANSSTRALRADPID